MSEPTQPRVWLADYASALEEMARHPVDEVWGSMAASKAKEIREWLESPADPCPYGQVDCPGGSQCVCALPAAAEATPEPLAESIRRELDACPRAIRIREGGGAEDLAASVAVNLARLSLERPENARDAERYRWLRDNTYVEGYWIDGAGGVDTAVRVNGSAQYLDSSIDAARSGAKAAEARR